MPRPYQPHEARQFRRLRDIFRDKVIQPLLQKHIQEDYPGHLELDPNATPPCSVLQVSMRDHSIQKDDFQSNMLGGQLRALAEQITHYQQRYHTSKPWWRFTQAMASNHPLHMLCGTIKAYLSALSWQNTFSEADLLRTMCWFDYIGEINHSNLFPEEEYPDFAALLSDIALSLCAPSSLDGNIPVYDIILGKNDTRPLQDDLKQLKHHIEGILQKTPLALLHLISHKTFPRGMHAFCQSSDTGHPPDTTPGRQVWQIIKKIKHHQRCIVYDEQASHPDTRVVERNANTWSFSESTSTQDYAPLLTHHTPALQHHVIQVLGLIERLNDLWMICHAGCQIAQRGGEVLTYWYAEGALSPFLTDTTDNISSLQEAIAACVQMTDVSLHIQTRSPPRKKSRKKQLNDWKHNHRHGKQSLASIQHEIQLGLKIIHALQLRHLQWKAQHQLFLDTILFHQHAFLHAMGASTPHLIEPAPHSHAPHRALTLPQPLMIETPQADWQRNMPPPWEADLFFTSIAEAKEAKDDPLLYPYYQAHTQQLRQTRGTLAALDQLWTPQIAEALLNPNTDADYVAALGLQIEIALQHARSLGVVIPQDLIDSLSDYVVQRYSHSGSEHAHCFFITADAQDRLGRFASPALVSHVLQRHGPSPWIHALDLITLGPQVPADTPWSAAWTQFHKHHAITQILDSAWELGLDPASSLPFQQLAASVRHPWHASPDGYASLHTAYMAQGQTLYQYLIGLENPRRQQHAPLTVCSNEPLLQALDHLVTPITWDPRTWSRLFSPRHWIRVLQQRQLRRDIRPMLHIMHTVYTHADPILQAWRAALTNDTPSVVHTPQSEITWSRHLHHASRATEPLSPWEQTPARSNLSFGA